MLCILIRFANIGTGRFSRVDCITVAENGLEVFGHHSFVNVDATSIDKFRVRLLFGCFLVRPEQTQTSNGLSPIPDMPAKCGTDLEQREEMHRRLGYSIRFQEESATMTCKPTVDKQQSIWRFDQ